MGLKIYGIKCMMDTIDIAHRPKFGRKQCGIVLIQANYKRANLIPYDKKTCLGLQYYLRLIN